MSIYGSIGFTRQSKGPTLKVDKKTEQKIKAEIKKLQDKRSQYYNDDDITDEQLMAIASQINKQINQLINSMY